MPILDKYNLTTIKAEVLCAELLQNGLTFDKVIYQPCGSFRQSFRPDIESIPEQFDDKDGFPIAVNRDGIYDRLPEGLFHQTRGNGKTMLVADMVTEHKRFRDEEKNARKFFLPFEQEIFRYGVMVEEEERQRSMGFYDDGLQEAFLKFWDIDSNLPREAAKVLVRIMPWAATIKGNLTLTAKALELMLGQKVIAKVGNKKNKLITNASFMLGTSVLGMDSVAGIELHEDGCYWHFTIAELSPKQVYQYTSGKPYGIFIKQFEELLIPVEIDIVFDYEIKKTEQDEAEQVLGYSLSI